MIADAVVTTLDILHEAGVRSWVGGGWGIDALVGFETRNHADLDVVVHPLERAVTALESHGFVRELDSLPVRVLYRHRELGDIDLHPIERTVDGWLQEGPGGRPFLYPDAELTVGTIAGRVVPCISASLQLSFHRGYEPAATDHADIAALVDAGLLPPGSTPG